MNRDEIKTVPDAITKLMKESKLIDASKLYMETCVLLENDELCGIGALEDVKKVVSARGNVLFDELLLISNESLYQQQDNRKVSNAKMDEVIECVCICKRVTEYVNVSCF